LKVIETIRTSIQIDPFISICKLRQNILSTLNVFVSRELIRMCITKLGLSRKKARFFGSPKNLKEKTDLFLIERSKYILLSLIATSTTAASLLCASRAAELTRLVRVFRSAWVCLTSFETTNPRWMQHSTASF